jgi:transposase-like protein
MRHRHAHAHLRRRQGVEIEYAPSTEDAKLYEWECPRCKTKNREYEPDPDDPRVICTGCDTDFIIESIYG